MRHGDFGHRAADLHGLQVAQTPGDPPLQPLERGDRGIFGQRLGHAEPRVLMASCSDVSDCVDSAATPSKARVTSIRRVISRTGSTFELSTAPCTTPSRVKSRIGVAGLSGTTPELSARLS